jgi:folylpolyglutamate synthase/dihydropteroate synthase
LERVSAKVSAVFLDVSHNAPAVEKVLSCIQSKHPGKAIRAVCGFGKLKDSSSMLNYLLGCCKAVHIVSKPGCKLAKIEDIEKNARTEAEKLGKQEVL